MQVVNFAISVHRSAAIIIVVVVLNAVQSKADVFAVFNGNQSHKYFDKKFKIQQKHGPFLNICY